MRTVLGDVKRLATAKLHLGRQVATLTLLVGTHIRSNGATHCVQKVLTSHMSEAFEVCKVSGGEIILASLDYAPLKVSGNNKQPSEL